MEYEVILVAPEQENFLQKEFNGMKINYYQVPIDRTGINPYKDLKTIAKLCEIIKIEKPEITYAFGGAKAAIYTTIAASKRNVSRNFCMINGLGSIFRGSGIKSNIIKKIMSFLFKYSLAKSSGVLFQNRDDLYEFVDNDLINESKCIIVNGSGVNLDKYPFTSPTVYNVFLFVGRLLGDKGIYEFIDAAKIIKQKYPKTEFWILGGYDTNHTSVKENEIFSWVNSGLVKYFGRQDNVLPFYQKSSVFVLPSYHEGTPRTCLEAMAVGRPVITTDAPGCKETVIDSVTGFLVPVKDYVNLSEKMEYFILNPQAISDMGNKAHMFVREKYDVNKVNKSIIDFLLFKQIKSSLNS